MALAMLENNTKLPVNARNDAEFWFLAEAQLTATAGISESPLTYTDPTGMKYDEGAANTASTLRKTREEERDNERPDKPYSQQVLPKASNGVNQACLFRALVHQAEIAAGFNFSINELNDLYKDALGAKDITKESRVNKPEKVLSDAFKKAGLDLNPTLDNKPEGAKGEIDKLKKITEIDTGVSSLHMVKTETHFQSMNTDGTLELDPWGSDLTKYYKNNREVYSYVHY